MNNSSSLTIKNDDLTYTISKNQKDFLIVDEIGYF